MATDKILDAGMVLPGAPKDRAKNILKNFDVDKLTINIYDSIGFPELPGRRLDYDELDARSKSLMEDWQKNLSKAKVWPSPSFVDLLESGIPYPVVIGFRELYDSLPSSPVFPVPDELATLAELLLAAKPFEDRLTEIWAPWVEVCAQHPPSYSRIMQQWATLYSAYQTGYGRNQELLDRASSLFGPMPEVERNLLFQCCKKTDIAAGEILGPVNEKYRSYSRYYDGIGLPRKEFKRNASLRDGQGTFARIIGDDNGLGFREFAEKQSNRNNYEFTSILRALPDEFSEFETPEDADLFVGRVFGRAFRALKNKPKLLANKTDNEAVSEAPDKEAASLPKRPIRLNEAETTALLNEVDTQELHDTPFYQSFDPLVEAGIIRGAQIGNWVPQKERPALVRKNYDAIMSLSSTLGITPSLVGLGNPVSNESMSVTDDGLIEDVYSGDQALGFAFGARGKSSASAHFEPGLFVINLTRKNGAGSLAHEWAHAIDSRLGGLLDYSRMNNMYHPTDVKRVTLSDSVRYFSEYSALYWFFQTHKQSSFAGHEAQERQHRAHIENGLRKDLDLTSDQREDVINLMVGMSHLVRDAYHVEKTPKEVKDQLLKLTAAGFHGYADGADSALNRMLNLSLDAAEGNQGLKNEVLTWYGYAKSFFDDPTMDPFDEKSYFSGNIDGYQLSYGLPKAIVQKLSVEARRDFTEEDTNSLEYTLRDFLHSSVMIAALETSAKRTLTNTMLPPHPDSSEQELRMEQGWRAALRDALSQAPLPFLKKLSLFNDRYTARETIFHRAIDPTDMARAAGVLPTKLFEDKEAASYVRRIHQALGRITAIPKALNHYYRHELLEKGLSPQAKAQILTLDADVGTAISQVHAGVFQVPDLLDATSEKYGKHFLNKDLNVAYSTFDSETRERTLLPDYKNLSQRELFDSLMNETNPRPFQLCSMEDGRFLAMALLDTHVKSDYHDGTWASLAESFMNPSRLQPLPPGLMTYLADFEDRLAPAPSNAPENDEEWSALIDNLPKRVMGMPSLKVLSAARHAHIVNDPNSATNRVESSHADMMMAAFGNALVTKDVSGLHTYDAAANGRALRSFRYHENDENIALLASFFPEKDREYVAQQLAPEKFSQYFYGNNQKAMPSYLDDWSSPTEHQLTEHRKSAIKHALTGYAGLYSSSIDRQTSRFKDAQTASLANDIRYESIDVANGRHFDKQLLRFGVSPYVRLSTQYDNGEMYENGSIKVGKRRYWSQTIELFARLTEKVIFERLAESGNPDPFLVTTPTRAAQDAKISSIKDIETGSYMVPGKHYPLCYPAASDLNRMMATFDKDVVPTLQPALNALFPESVLHYERYLQNAAEQGDIPTLDARVHREDASTQAPVIDDEATWRMNDEAEEHSQSAPATSNQSHEVFSLNPSSGPGL